MNYNDFLETVPPPTDNDSIPTDDSYLSDVPPPTDDDYPYELSHDDNEIDHFDKVVCIFEDYLDYMAQKYPDSTSNDVLTYDSYKQYLNDVNKTDYQCSDMTFEQLVRDFDEDFNLLCVGYYHNLI